MPKPKLRSATIVATLALLTPAAVSAAPPYTPGGDFIIEAPQAWDKVDHSVKRGDPLLVVPIHSPGAARIQDDVTLAAPLRGKVQLHARDVLWQVTESRDPMYCATAVNGLMFGVETPCLVDTDGDGAFDAQVWAGKPKRAFQQVMGLGSGRTVTDLTLNSHRTPLAKPIAFNKLDGKDGPSANLVFFWEGNRHAHHGTSVTVSVWMRLYFLGPPFQIESKPIEAVLDEKGEGDLEVAGCKFHINGLDDNALHFRYVDLPSGQPLHVPGPGIARTIIVVVPR